MKIPAELSRRAKEQFRAVLADYFGECTSWDLAKVKREAAWLQSQFPEGSEARDDFGFVVGETEIAEHRIASGEALGAADVTARAVVLMMARLHQLAYGTPPGKPEQPFCKLLRSVYEEDPTACQASIIAGAKERFRKLKGKKGRILSDNTLEHKFMEIVKRPTLRP